MAPDADRNVKQNALSQNPAQALYTSTPRGAAHFTLHAVQAEVSSDVSCVMASSWDPHHGHAQISTMDGE